MKSFFFLLFSRLKRHKTAQTAVLIDKKSAFGYFNCILNGFSNTFGNPENQFTKPDWK